MPFWNRKKKQVEDVKRANYEQHVSTVELHILVDRLEEIEQSLSKLTLALEKAGFNIARSMQDGTKAIEVATKELRKASSKSR